MKETLLLTRILYKNALNKSNEKSSFGKIIKNILVFLAIVYIAFVVGYLSYQLIDSLKQLHQEQAFLGVCLVLTMIVSVARAILTSLNILYFSKDIEFLLPLPVKPINIVLSKINILLISGYIMELFTFAIPIGIYAYVVEVNFSFFLYTILTLLFIPIIPTLIATILTVAIMSCTNLLRNKDIVQYLTVAITLIFVIGLQIWASSMSDVTNFMIANKLVEINGLVTVIGDYFITLKQGIIAITKCGSIEALKNISLLIFESIVFYILAGYAISKVYIKSAINLVSSSSRRTKLNEKKIIKNSVAISYVKKELKLLFRNPIFFMQCVVPVILFPILISIPFYDSIKKMPVTQFRMIEKSLEGNMQNPMILGMILLIINFMYLFNYIAVTAISRDGENAIFMKYIPVPLNKQCIYKIIPSFILNIIPVLYILCILKYFVPSIENVFLVEIIVVALIENMLISYLSIIIDIIRPKLHWVSEYSVTKQNINMLYSTIMIIFLEIIILAICAYFENIHIVVVLISAMSILTIIFINNFIKQYSNQVFKKIS